MNNLVLAKKVQRLASCFLYEENMRYADIDEWKEIQGDLMRCMNYLVFQKGKSIEDEAEIVLAILMGYTFTIRNTLHVNNALERAEHVLPLLADPVLKCKLAFFCYQEFPDEELMEMVQSLMVEVKRKGREDEIQLIEKLIVEL